jgi:type I restriction enzyme S subunit
MTPQAFLAYFETFAAAPNGIAKLRELILQLAVQGKLVPQDVNDEPAIETLARIESEREACVAAGEIPHQRPVSPITEAAELFSLPASWQWARFGHLCLFIEAGWSPKCEERPRIGDEWGVIKISAVTWGRFNADENKTLPSHMEPRLSCEIRSGDFLMSRANTAELVARSVVVEEAPPRLLLNDKVLRVKFPEEVDNLYVNLFNNCTVARRYYVTVASGTSESMLNVSRENILEMPIPLPPLAEQRRIVEKVDQLLGLCDELAARQAAQREKRQRLVGATLDRLVSTRNPSEFPNHAHRLRNHFDQLFDTPTTIPQLRQTILQLAVQGQLVPQDPNDEPAKCLRQRLAVFATELLESGRTSRRKPVPEIDESDVPFLLPEQWAWVRFGELAAEVEYGTSQKASEIGGDVPVLRMNAIRDGRVVLEESKFVASTIKDLPKLYLKNGDILFNRTNSYELVGKSGVFYGPDNKFTFASYLIRGSLLPELLPEFITIAMNAKYYRTTQIEPEVTQQCGQANFNGTKLQHSLIPLPPLAEQKRIVTKVTELLSLCDALEAKLTQAESASTQLLSAAVYHLLQH